MARKERRNAVSRISGRRRRGPAEPGEGTDNYLLEDGETDQYLIDDLTADVYLLQDA